MPVLLATAAGGAGLGVGVGVEAGVEVGARAVAVAVSRKAASRGKGSWMLSKLVSRGQLFLELVAGSFCLGMWESSTFFFFSDGLVTRVQLAGCAKNPARR